MRLTEDARQPHLYRTASSNPSVSVPLYKLAGSETIFWSNKEEEIRRAASRSSRFMPVWVEFKSLDIRSEDIGGWIRTKAQPERAATGVGPGRAVKGGEPTGVGQAPGGQPLGHPPGSPIEVMKIPVFARSRASWQPDPNPPDEWTLLIDTMCPSSCNANCQVTSWQFPN